MSPPRSHVEDASVFLPPAVTTAPAAEQKPDAGLAPLDGEWIQELFDGDRSVGFVSPPVGATGPRPIAIVVHGAGDRPDWECSAWRAILGPVPFVVCAQGRPHPAWKGTFVWSSSAHARQAIEQALRATRARFAVYLGDGPRVLAGFSQGAMMATEIAARDGATYPFVVFLEGLGNLSPSAFSIPFLKSGGRRVLLGCSQGGCAASREVARRSLVANGVEARVNYAGPIGHTLDNAVVASVRKDLRWLLQAEPAWTDVAESLPRTAE